MELLAFIPMVALPLAAAIAICRGDSFRAALVRSATYWGIAVFAVTETLSAFHSLTSTGLAVAWLFIDLAAVVYLRRLGRASSPFRAAVSQLPKTDLLLLSGVVLVLATVGFTALLYPPNTDDSMVYHMPRIVRWLHNRSAAFYTTDQFRQLKMPPWAEFAMLQFHGITGGDRFDNLVQWFAMVGSVTGVSLIAGKLGASLRGQVLAAVICATISQGLLEASGAKNDYVVGFWLVVLVYYLLAYKDDRNLETAIGIGASLGLACLTKTTAYVLAPPLILSIAVLWHRGGWRLYARHILIVAAVALSLNSVHFARNYRIFGTPLGPSAEVPPNHFEYLNDRFNPFVTLSNVVRNVGLHIGSPSGPQNLRSTNAAKSFLALFGIDANDGGTTWENTRFMVPGPTLHEGGAGNFPDLVLILITLALLLARLRSVELRPSLWLSIGLVGAFLMFCTVLRWQPWHTRLHLPLFLLWSAVIATVTARFCPRFVTSLLGLVLLVSSVPALLQNEVRPLTGDFTPFNQPRSALYFADSKRELLAPYLETAMVVAAHGCNDIGLSGSGLYEYPLMALLGDLDGALNVHEIGLSNATSIYDNPGSPCVIVCPNCQQSFPQFTTRKLFGAVTVLAKP